MKKIKNVTLSPITINLLGITIQPNEEIEAHPQEYDLWAVAAQDDVSFIAKVTNRDIEVHDNHGAISDVGTALWWLKRFQTTESAIQTPFDPSDLEWTSATNTQKAIEDCYVASKGIRTFSFELHYVSGTGLNTRMNNGAFFRVRPGTFNSGSYSGYPAAFPLQMPFNCKLFSIILTFREASFDWDANFGPILFEIETRDHYYNGSDIHNRILVRFGNWRYSSTGHSTHQFELFYNDDTGGQGFEYISGPPTHSYGDMVGCRFVKAPSGDRRINSFRDIVMKLNFEEVVS